MIIIIKGNNPQFGLKLNVTGNQGAAVWLLLSKHILKKVNILIYHNIIYHILIKIWILFIKNIIYI